MPKIDNLDDIKGRWVVDPFTEVTVNAGSLLVTAELLEALAEFFDTHDAARVQYGRFLASREHHREQDVEQTHLDAWGVMGLVELNEAAEFMRTLAQPDAQEED